MWNFVWSDWNVGQVLKFLVSSCNNKIMFRFTNPSKSTFSWTDLNDNHVKSIIFLWTFQSLMQSLNDVSYFHIIYMGIVSRLIYSRQCTINWLKSENNRGEQNCFSSKSKINFFLKKNNNLPGLLKNIWIFRIFSLKKIVKKTCNCCKVPTQVNLHSYILNH